MIGKKRTGDEAVFFNLVKNLAKIDSQNEYKLFTDITDEKILEGIKSDLGIAEKNNFKIISLRTRNKFTWNFWTLPLYLRKNPVDIYLTQYITPFFVPRKIKIATIIHDISFNFYPQLIKFADLFFLKILIPMSLKRADKIIAVSEFTKNEIIKFYKIAPEKIEVAYNAVGDNFLMQIAGYESAQANISELENVRKKYNLPEKFILYLGTMQPRKNLPVLIEAFAKIKKEFPPLEKGGEGGFENPNSSYKSLSDSPFSKGRELRLVLAGGKGHNYDQKIDETIKKNSLENEVIFPGFIDEEDKSAIYKLASIFCFPSLYEGFGIPVLEAMASGVSAIVSDIAPHKEIAKDSVLYFNPKSSDDLAEKLVQLLENEDLKNNLIRNGKERAQDFSWKKSAEKTLEVLRNIPIDN